ncbi:Receptor-type tyrosine-protein phosphatase F, partial [Clonorchis sinensis]
PEKPYNISVKIKPFVDDRVLANISWAYNSTCAISTFNVTGKNPAGKMITESIKKKHVALYWQDRCYPLPFAVRAVSSIGVDGDTSEKYIVFHEAPNTPMDVHLLRLGQTTWSVSWNDSSQCQNYSGYHYTVAVYDKENQLVDEQNTTDHSMILENLDWCLQYWVRVRAIGSAGRSNESTALKLQDSSAPNMLTDIQLSRLAHTKWMVSWNDSSECQNYSGNHYTVAVYDTENQLVNEQNTTDQSMILEDLDWCLEYWVRVRAIGPAGWSNESTALKLQDTVAPTAPTDIQLSSTGPQKWLIYWNDSSECQTHPEYQYVVIIYDQKQQIVNERNTSDRQTILEGLDLCSEYWVSVRAIGPGGQSNESGAIKIYTASAPSAPTDVQVHRYGQTKLMVSWNDSSECQNYSGYHYTVAVYDKENQLVNEQNTTHQSMILEDLDRCLEYWVRVRAIGSAGRSNESTAVKIRDSAERPHNLSTKVLRRHENGSVRVNISWTYKSECNYTGFRVVYVSPAGENMIRSTRNVYVIIRWGNYCHPIAFQVRAITSSSKTVWHKQVIHLNQGPKKPTDVQVHRTGPQQWSVFWNASSDCQEYPGYHFIVTVYDKQNQTVNQRNVTDDSVALEGFELCTDYWVRVRTIESGMQSEESDAVKLCNAPAPKTPTNLRIYKAKESQNWLLFWDDSSECQAHPDYHYILSIYNLYYQRVLQRNVNGKYVTLADFYVCAGFWIRLRSIASWGQSKDSLAVRLSDFAAPRPPTNFRMDRNAGSQAWFLSWDDRSECQTYPGYHYLVSIFDRYDQRALQKRVRTKYVMLDDFYVCADFRVRIRSVGSGEQSIESPAVRLSEFSGKQPEPPYNVMIQLQVLKRMVTVYWTQNCARSFTVAFYVGTLVTRMESTYRNTMTFGNLPRNQSLHVGITAISEYGMSDEAPSSLFYITPS